MSPHALVRLLGIAVFGMVLFALGQPAGGQDKDKKFEVPTDAVYGKVKAVDLKASSFTVTLRNGKERTFGVTDKTEFWGPKGGDRGTGAKGLKDECMDKGYDIRIMPAKDAKIAKDVY